MVMTILGYDPFPLGAAGQELGVQACSRSGDDPAVDYPQFTTQLDR
jgi:hypothetical protein